MRINWPSRAARAGLTFWPSVSPQAARATHRLAPTSKTVTWGYFDAKTPPALRVQSGDTVDIESLVAAPPALLELAAASGATRSSRRFSKSIAPSRTAVRCHIF